MTTKCSDELKVAVVGCGPVGLTHARAYCTCSDARLVAVCDLARDKAESAAAQMGCESFTSLEAMLAQAKPDLVSIVVPFDKMVAPIRQCLQAGVHVLTEKPISFDASEILSLVELAKQNHVQFGVDFNQRFSHASVWFRQLLDEGKLGELTWALGYYGQSSGENFYQLREKAIHFLDLWTWFMGKICSVTAQVCWGSDYGREHKSPVVLAATLQFESGGVAALTTGGPRGGELFGYYELVGTAGRVYCENFVGRAVYRPKQGEACFREMPWNSAGAGYWDTAQAHLAQVVESIRLGRDVPVPASQAAYVQHVCDGIAQAVETERRVDVS